MNKGQNVGMQVIIHSRNVTQKSKRSNFEQKCYTTSITPSVYSWICKSMVREEVCQDLSLLLTLREKVQHNRL